MPCPAEYAAEVVGAVLAEDVSWKSSILCARHVIPRRHLLTQVVLMELVVYAGRHEVAVIAYPPVVRYVHLLLIVVDTIGWLCWFLQVLLLRVLAILYRA